MSGWLGAIELLLVLGAVLGFGIFEIVKLRRHTKASAVKPDRDTHGAVSGSDDTDGSNHPRAR